MTENNIVMVVDDQPVNLKMLHDALHKQYTVLAASSGERALYQLEHSRPDIVLLDVMMPGLDGFETCQRIHAIPGLEELPIIFMTALTEVKDKVKGFESGGVDYLTKPLELAEVRERLKTHLGIQQLRRELEQKNRLLAQQNEELEQALAEVKTLSGILPICCRWKKDKG